MLRLEDQRILRDPNPPQPVVLKPATAKTPAVFSPPPPSDLVRLLQDSEGRTRRRAALAVGRVGLRRSEERRVGKECRARWEEWRDGRSRTADEVSDRLR